MTYRARSLYGIATESGLPLSFYNIHIKLIDLCNASVGGPDDLLPVTFPDISFFTWRNEFEVTFSQSGTGYQIQGELTSIEVVSEPSLPRVIYVDDDAPPGGDGLTWPTAYKYLQDGLDDADPCDVIWVAEGTYFPTSDYGLAIGERGKHFRTRNHISIYGGFAGYGSIDPNARDVDLYETVLSGDIGVPDETNDNCYHVFYHPDDLALDPNAILDGFTIRGGNSNSSRPNDRGGGMFNGEHSGPTVTNCRFNGNWAGFRGGGMFNDDYCGLTVIACTFSGNWADWGGGGMSNDEYSTTVITDCNFIGNHAVRTGGGMHNEEDTDSLVVTNCTFSGNSADIGGGMHNDEDTSPNVTGCTFDDNSARRGGGISNNDDSSPTVTGCIFSGNSASEHGGGIYNDGGEGHCNPIITNCTFSGNSASDYGGGMYNYGYEGHCNPILTNCTFSSNSANGGGGMYNRDCSPIVANCTFTGNSANGTYAIGGGMSNRKSSPIVTNCTFSGNSANGTNADGGGMCNNNNCNPIVNCCTFNGNSATRYGGGMNNYLNSSPVVTNCILRGNTATNGNEIYNASSSSPLISYCDIAGSGGSGSWDSNLGSDVGGNIDVDPLFADPDGPDGIIGTEDDNLRLMAGSLCIDAGDNSVVDPNGTDLDGNPRIINGIVDMGAYEALLSIEADVHIVPRVISRSNRMKRIIAIMRLPDGISKRDVADEPFMLYAGDSEGIEATWQRVVGWRRRASVFALFDKAQLMNAVEHNGRVELTVVGRLESGQYIQGSDTVRIVQPRRRRPRWQHGRRRR